MSEETKAAETFGKAPYDPAPEPPGISDILEKALQERKDLQRQNLDRIAGNNFKECQEHISYLVQTVEKLLRDKAELLAEQVKNTPLRVDLEGRMRTIWPAEHALKEMREIQEKLAAIDQHRTKFWKVLNGE